MTPTHTLGTGFLDSLVESLFKRTFEWMMAGICVLMGLGLMDTGDTFAASANYSGLQQIGHEGAWGVILLVIGLLTLIGLGVNGLKPNASGALRSTMAVLRFALWVVVTWSFLASGEALDVFLLSTPTYAFLAIGELIVIVRAQWDRGIGTSTKS